MYNVSPLDLVHSRAIIINEPTSPDIGWESDVNFFAPESKEKRDDILLRPESGTGFDYSGLTFPLGKFVIPNPMV